MDWFYAQDGQQKGPVTAEELQQLVLKGSVTGDTLVWHEGLPDWIPYAKSDGKIPAPATSATDPTGVPLSSIQTTCIECGKSFPPSETITISGSAVCANCKPIFLQKVKEGVATGGSGMWRQKKLLVTTLDVTLPRRCVKCNEPTDTEQMRRKLYWYPPYVYLGLLLNIIVVIILAAIFKKKAFATVSLCTRHRTVRRNAILTGWLLTIGGFGALITGLVNSIVWLWVLGGVALLGGLVYGIGWGRIVTPTKINTENAWLSGCHKDFLAGFPEWDGPK